MSTSYFSIFGSSFEAFRSTCYHFTLIFSCLYPMSSTTDTADLAKAVVESLVSVSTFTQLGRLAVTVSLTCFLPAFLTRGDSIVQTILFCLNLFSLLP